MAEICVPSASQTTSGSGPTIPPTTSYPTPNTGILRNISFQSADVQILTIQPDPRVLIRWALMPTNQPINRLRFYIDRGESDTDMEAITPALPWNGLPEFVDTTAGLLDNYRHYYYRIRAVEWNGTAEVQTFQSPLLTWDGNLDTAGIYMVEEHQFAFRYVFGVPALIFRRIRDGIYCTECFDTVLKRVTKSNCKTCLGTGKVLGFYPPVEAWVDIQDPQRVAPHIAERGDVQVEKTTIRLTNYPIVRDGDLILEVQKNRIWKLNAGQTTEKHRVTVLQMYDATEVGRNDIEQNIMVDEATKIRLVNELIAQRLEAEF